METDLETAYVDSASVTANHVVVVLSDGRRISTPLDWYPSLRDASPDVRANIEISPFGLHWPDLDEDLSIEGMLRGERPPERLA